MTNINPVADETPAESSAAHESERVADLTLDLARSDVDGEGFLGKLGRLNVARLQANEVVRHQDYATDQSALND